MASRSIDWDSVLVTLSPKKKEIVVSFPADGGFGRFGSGTTGEPSYPGAPTTPAAPDGSEGTVPPDEALPADIPPAETPPECLSHDCDAIIDFLAANPDLEADFLWRDELGGVISADGNVQGGLRVIDITNNNLDPAGEITATKELFDAGTPNGVCTDVTLYGWVAEGSVTGNSRIINTQDSWVSSVTPNQPAGSQTWRCSSLLYLWDKGANGADKTASTEEYILLRPQGQVWLRNFFGVMYDRFVSVAATVTASANYATRTVTVTAGDDSTTFSGDLTGAWLVSYAIDWVRTGSSMSVGLAVTITAPNGVKLTTSASDSGSAFTNEEAVASGNPEMIWARISDGKYPEYCSQTSSNGTSLVAFGSAATEEPLRRLKAALDRAFKDYAPPSYCEVLP